MVTFGKMESELDLRTVADEHSPADLRGGELAASLTNSTSKPKYLLLPNLIRVE